VHAIVKPMDVIDIEGFKIPQGYYIHRGHSWVKLEEGYEVRVGVDDFALRLLGPLDRIEAPLMGKEIKQDDPDILMNRGALDARLLSPVSGVVTAVNSNLREHGDLANQDPYSKGWVLRVHANNIRHDLKNLMIGNETREFYTKEVDRLYQAIEEEVGPLAIDGGQLGDDIFGSIPQDGWGRLAKLFLHT
jgi:glycine cleavage system H lipoate-binding protein